MITLKQHKRGDTFSFITTFNDSQGQPMIGIVSKLKCQVRDSKNILVCEMTIQETVTAGEYLFSVPASITKDWPLEILYLDIEYKDNDIVTSSETMSFRVIRDITREEV